jgi:hypothetical protein
MAAGQLSYPHLGHTVTPGLRRVPHTSQGRPLRFVTSRGMPRIPSTRDRVNVLGSLLGFMYQVSTVGVALFSVWGTDRC